MLSRSGGIFAAISDQVLAQGGVIYGAGMDEKFNVVHKRATNERERDELRGSKYVQSDMNNAYQLACEDLKAGRLVLFTGTPCQVDGIKALCPKNVKNISFVWILCAMVFQVRESGMIIRRIWNENIMEK